MPPPREIRDTLDWWISDWKELLRDPARLSTLNNEGSQLTLLAHQLASVRTPFDPLKDDAGYKGHLVQQIRSSIAAGSATSRLLQQAAPAEWGAFITTLRQPKIDPGRVRVPLEKLVALIRRPSAIVPFLESALTTADAADISAYSTLLAQALVTLDDPKTLAALPEQVLSQYGMMAALADQLTALTSDQAKLQEIWTYIQEAAAAASRTDLGATFAKRSPSGTAGVTYPNVHRLATTAHPLLWPTQDHSNSDEDAGAVTLGMAVLLAWSRQTSNAVLFWLGLMFGTRGNTGLEDLAERDYSTALAGLANEVLLPWADTLDTIEVADDETTHHPLSPALQAGTRSLLVNLLTAAATARLSAAIPREFALRLGQKLEVLFIEEKAWWTQEDQTSDWTQEKLVRSWAARRDVQALCVEAIRELSPLFGKEASAAFKELAAQETVPIWGNEPDATLRSWLELVADASKPWHNTWKGIRWAVLPPDVIGIALRGLAAEYETPKVYDVVLTVSGVDAQEERWLAGSIMWYSQARMNFGELFPSDPSKQLDPKCLHGWIVVQASSGSAARTIGTANLEAALDTLTFALSVSSKHTGLQPLIDNDSHVGSVNSGSSWSGGGWEREELADVKAARDDEVIRFSKLYAPILERFRGSGNSSELDQRLIRALSWYRRGRWDNNPVRRFLSYFVAFEQVFLAGTRNKKSKLPEMAAPLIHTWVNARTPFRIVLDQQLERAQDFRKYALAEPRLSSSLDSLREFDGWRDDIRPLVVPTSITDLLTAIAEDPNHPLHISGTVSQYQQELVGWADSINAWETERQREEAMWRHSLHVLVQRRNEIAHEGIGGAPDMVLHARALEQALESVLSKLARLALNQPHVDTIEKVLLWHRNPWAE